MDIRKIASGARAVDSTQPRRSMDTSAAPGHGTYASSDRVTMSDRAQAHERTRRAAVSVPEVRQELVDAIRRQLASGALVPDPDRIARALLAQSILD
jgi:flagellar biosynthesis anti-sigma factor FlgM